MIETRNGEIVFGLGGEGSARRKKHGHRPFHCGHMSLSGRPPSLCLSCFLLLVFSVPLVFFGTEYY